MVEQKIPQEWSLHVWLELLGLVETNGIQHAIDGMEVMGFVRCADRSMDFRFPIWISKLQSAYNSDHTMTPKRFVSHVCELCCNGRKMPRIWMSSKTVFCGSNVSLYNLARFGILPRRLASRRIEIESISYNLIISQPLWCWNQKII